jgi:hypothetical protein
MKEKKKTTHKAPLAIVLNTLDRDLVRFWHGVFVPRCRGERWQLSRVGESNRAVACDQQQSHNKLSTVHDELERSARFKQLEHIWQDEHVVKEIDDDESNVAAGEYEQ